MTECMRAVRLIRARTKITKEDVVSAARWFKRQYPELAFSVMEEIGCWPSTDPELAALQRVWP